MTNDQCPMTNWERSSLGHWSLGNWALIGHWCLLIAHSTRQPCTFMPPSITEGAMPRSRGVLSTVRPSLSAWVWALCLLLAVSRSAHAHPEGLSLLTVMVEDQRVRAQMVLPASALPAIYP